MCMPFGPRWGRSGTTRVIFNTLDDCNSSVMKNKAKEKYADNGQAIAKIREFISVYIEHTEKWIVNELIDQDILLAYIWAEEENRALIHKIYLAEKKKK